MQGVAIGTDVEHTEVAALFHLHLLAHGGVAGGGKTVEAVLLGGEAVAEGGLFGVACGVYSPNGVTHTGSGFLLLFGG